MPAEMIPEARRQSRDETGKFRDQRTCLLALIGTIDFLRATLG